MRDVEKFGSGLKSALLGPLGAITGVLAGGGIAAGIKMAADRIDDLAKSSDRLGIATQSLAGLRLAATEAGASAQDLDTGMAKLQKTIADGAAGNKTAKDSLDAIGLSVSALSGMHADDQFKAVADAIKGLGNAGERTAATIDIFGRGGMSLANTLALGSEGLNQATKDAEALGLAISRVDAAKVEEANDAFGRIGKAIEGVFNKVTVLIAPLITGLSNVFSNAISKVDNLGSILDQFTRFALNSAKVIGDGWQGLAIMASSVGVALGYIGQVFTFIGALATSVINQQTTRWNAFVNIVTTGGTLLKDALLFSFEAIKLSWTVSIETMRLAFAGFLSYVSDGLSYIPGFEDLAQRARETAENVSISAASAMQAQVDKQAEAFATMKGSASAFASAVANDFGALITINPFGELSKAQEEFFMNGMKNARAFTAQMKETFQSVTNVDLGTWGFQFKEELATAIDSTNKMAQVRAEARAVEVEATQIHVDKLKEIQSTGSKDTHDVTKSWDDLTENEKMQMRIRAVQGASTVFANLTQLQNTHNKTAQRIGKIAAKAKIVTDTAAAAMGCWASLSGIPIVGPALAAAAAATAVLAGGIQLSNVDSGSMGSGGNGPTDVSTTNIGGVQAPATASAGQTLVLQGDIFSAESLVALFKDAQERGIIIEGVRRG
jgi:hypothetical protein